MLDHAELEVISNFKASKSAIARAVIAGCMPLLADLDAAITEAELTAKLRALVK